MIKWIEKWYASHCDGDWEHGSGITIRTIDNPGWEITIDLDGTEVELADEEWKMFEKEDNDWYGYKISDNIFNAAGDPKKLEFLLSLFKEKLDSR